MKQNQLLVMIAIFMFGCGRENVENKNGLVISSKYADFEKTATLNVDELKNIPRKLDLRNEMTSVKDQGDRGACSFFSAAGLMEFAIKRLMKIDINLSEEYIANISKKNHYSPREEGGSIFGNLFSSIYIDQKIMLEKDLPYSPSWFLSGGPCNGMDRNNAHTPKECYSHDQLTPEIKKRAISVEQMKLITLKKVSTNELIKSMAQSKLPFGATVSVNQRGWANEKVHFTPEMRRECIEVGDTPENQCQSHAIILTGYNLDEKIFYFKNSWGSEWGDQGYGKISFDYIDRFSDENFYSVKLEAPLKLPKNFNDGPEPMSIDHFDFAQDLFNDQSIAISFKGKLQNIGHKSFRITSQIYLNDNFIGGLNDVKIVKEKTFVKDADTCSECYQSGMANLFFDAKELEDLHSQNSTFQKKQGIIFSKIEEITDMGTRQIATHLHPLDL